MIDNSWIDNPLFEHRKYKEYISKDFNNFHAIDILIKRAEFITCTLKEEAMTICNKRLCDIEIPGDQHDTMIPMIQTLESNYINNVKEYKSICKTIKFLCEHENCDKAEFNG